MIKTPKDTIKNLIEKYEAHVSFCDRKKDEAFTNDMRWTGAMWLEERTTYQKVLIDLYKVLEYGEPNTDLTDFPNELKDYQNNHKK